MMPRVLSLYLTDNYYIKKLLQGRLGLEPRNGIYGKNSEDGVTRLFYFPAAEFLIGRPGKRGKSAAYEYLEKCDESVSSVYYNAFEPGYAGALRWHILSKQMGLEKKDVRRCDLLTADFASGKGNWLTFASDDLSEAEVAEAELLSWTRQLIASAYSDAAADKGVDLFYDPLIFPLLAVIARPRAGQQVAAEKKRTLPSRPYRYLDLFCELDGKITMNDLTDILFEFYGGGLLSWPLTARRCAVQELENRILTPAALMETPYEETAMLYRYRNLPTGLYQRKEEACGLWLLDHDSFAETYVRLGERQKLVMDALIKRQLALFAPETVDRNQLNTVEAIKGGAKEHLHTASSLVRLLQIHAAGSQEELIEIMRRFSLSHYAGRQDGGYMLREDDRKLLSYLPAHLLSMDLYSQMRDWASEVIRSGKNMGRYKETIEKDVLGDVAKMVQRIDAAAQSTKEACAK